MNNELDLIDSTVNIWIIQETTEKLSDLTIEAIIDLMLEEKWIEEGKHLAVRTLSYNYNDQTVIRSWAFDLWSGQIYVLRKIITKDWIKYQVVKPELDDNWMYTWNDFKVENKQEILEWIQRYKFDFLPKNMNLTKYEKNGEYDLPINFIPIS